MSTKSIVEKVFDFIKADDKSLVSAMQKSIISEASNQIEDAKLEIDAIQRKQTRNHTSLTAKLAEAKEQEIEAFMQIELIKGSDARKSYIRKNYLQQICNAKYEVEKIENEIESSSEAVEKKVEEINGEIAKWQDVLDFWSDSKK